MANRTLFIKAPRTFVNKDGEEVTRWDEKGILIIKGNGSASIKFNDSEEWLQAFPPRPKAQES